MRNAGESGSGGKYTAKGEDENDEMSLASENEGERKSPYSDSVSNPCFGSTKGINSNGIKEELPKKRERNFQTH